MSGFYQRRDTTCNLIEIGIRIPESLLEDAFIGNMNKRNVRLLLQKVGLVWENRHRNARFLNRHKVDR
jgi:hypothetical protein